VGIRPGCSDIRDVTGWPGVVALVVKQKINTFQRVLEIDSEVLGVDARVIYFPRGIWAFYVEVCLRTVGVSCGKTWHRMLMCRGKLYIIQGCDRSVI
jgi:hypothetical protein